VEGVFLKDEKKGEKITEGKPNDKKTEGEPELTRKRSRG
jgi:hypothetical protein